MVSASPLGGGCGPDLRPGDDHLKLNTCPLPVLWWPLLPRPLSSIDLLPTSAQLGADRGEARAAAAPGQLASLPAAALQEAVLDGVRGASLRPAGPWRQAPGLSCDGLSDEISVVHWLSWGPSRRGQDQGCCILQHSS